MPRFGIRILAFLGLLLIIAIAFYTWHQKQSTYSNISLAPHRALYRLQTASIRNTTAIANVRGTMFYEWHESCDDWTTNQKFHMEFLYPEGDPMTLNSTYSTVESRNGENFHFSTQRERNQQQIEEIRGQAFFRGTGKGEAEFLKPEGAKFELSPETRFPTQHTLALLQTAMNGKLFFRAPLFDGSEASPAVDVSAVVGKAESYTPIESLKDNPLLKSPVHRVRMAFFTNKKEDQSVNSPDFQSETPDYEMTLMIHENGVVSEYKIDYPEFSLNASLEALDALPKECP